MSQPLLRAPIQVIAIGGSAGALTVLQSVIAALPVPLSVPVLVVMHVREEGKSLLVDLLRRTSTLAVLEPDDKQPLEPGTIYVAPPGYHLLVADRRSLSLSLEAPEHCSRPSIDVLFESLAHVFAAGALGVLLSGASADGARGLGSIARAHGITLVQAPHSAVHRTMPDAALALFTPDLVLEPAELAQSIARLSSSASRGQGGFHV